MPSYIERNTALAQAALDHALYFLELGANDRAAAYYQFASQQLQNVVKNLGQQESGSALEPGSISDLTRGTAQRTRLGKEPGWARNQAERM